MSFKIVIPARYGSERLPGKPLREIDGKAMILHWSWDDSVYPGNDVSLSDPLSVPSLYIYNAIHFFQKVRWNRLFSVIS